MNFTATELKLPPVLEVSKLASHTCLTSSIDKQKPKY
jgi:hypothetical protein